MAISTMELLGSSVIAIEELRGEDWWKQGVDKEICEVIYDTFRGDVQWISWSKIQRLLREEKRDIREEIKPELRERRLAREKERAGRKTVEEFIQEKEKIDNYDKEEREGMIQHIRQNGKIEQEIRVDVTCVMCRETIPKGESCIRSSLGIGDVFSSPYRHSYICMKCVKILQEKKKQQKHKNLMGLRKIKRSEVEEKAVKANRFQDKSGNWWRRIE